MLLSVSEVASRLRISNQHVRNLLNNGTITGVKVGKQWCLNSEDIEAYIHSGNIIINPPDHPRKSKVKPKLKALSFFSGAMGLDLGLELAGIETILACEFEKSCRKTIEINRPDLALLGNIWDYSADSIRSSAGLRPEDDIELIVGGPPCQAFSTAGARRGFSDERGNVFLKYIELITELRPKYVVIENVRGLLSAPLSINSNFELDEGVEAIPGGALGYIVKKLKDAGYGVNFNLYNSANFGSPQIRERVVIIGSRDGTKVPFLKPTHSEKGDYGLPKWKTFKEAINGLKEEDQNFIEFPEKRLKYYAHLKAGQYWKHLPENLKSEAMGKSYLLGGGKTGFFRRLAWDRPSPTLVTHPAMPATDLCHPSKNRPLSVQEYKRVQEFPDDWTICGNILDQYKQIGNAVPVSLGKAIGNAIISHMKGEGESDDFRNFQYSRYKATDFDAWMNELKKRMEA